MRKDDITKAQKFPYCVYWTYDHVDYNYLKKHSDSVLTAIDLAFELSRELDDLGFYSGCVVIITDDGNVIWKRELSREQEG